MFWIGLVVWVVAVGCLLCILGAAERDNEALRRAVASSVRARGVRRCYIEGDTEAEIAETLLRGLAKEVM